MKKEAKVHMLPTEDKTAIRYNSSLKIISKDISDYGVDNNDYISCQHLYVTTDEEIKVNQRCLNDSTGVVFTAEESELIIYNSRSHIHKIIATTAPKLAKLIAGGGEGNAGVWKMLPQIQQSFIEEYCKQGGIDKVLVEYMNGYINNRPVSNGVLKTDSNNCIIIHPVEESLLEECLNAIEFLSDEANTNQYSELIKNIKENL